MKTIEVEGQKLTEEQICLKFGGYINSLARPFGYKHGHEDARGEAMIALVKACRSFDPERGVPFGAYMTQQVRFALRKFARRCPSGLHVPTGTQQLRYQAHRADVLDKPAAEMAEVLGCTVEMAKRVRHAERATATLSLDSPSKTSADDPSTETLMGSVNGHEDDLTWLHVEEFLASLTERELYILEQHKRKVSQVVTAAELGCTQMAVSRTFGAIKVKAFETFMRGN